MLVVGVSVAWMFLSFCLPIFVSNVNQFIQGSRLPGGNARASTNVAQRLPVEASLLGARAMNVAGQSRSCHASLSRNGSGHRPVRWGEGRLVDNHMSRCKVQDFQGLATGGGATGELQLGTWSFDHIPGHVVRPRHHLMWTRMVQGRDKLCGRGDSSVGQKEYCWSQNSSSGTWRSSPPNFHVCAHLPPPPGLIIGGPMTLPQQELLPLASVSPLPALPQQEEGSHWPQRVRDSREPLAAAQQARHHPEQRPPSPSLEKAKYRCLGRSRVVFHLVTSI
jgi:hypothetical protein